MSIAPQLKIIGRGKDGARALPYDPAFALMSDILAGRVSDLELGGFALAMRIKGESPEELAAFMDAAAPHTLPLQSDRPALLLPSYNGARRLPNFTPLLALLLAREGVPVLVHGLTEDPGRVTSAEIFSALGLAACSDAPSVQAAWSRGEPAFMALDLLNPPLARLLAVRRVLGLRNSGHTMAKLLPAVPRGLRVVNHTHPEYAISLTQFLKDSRADALLMRGTEGEPVADCRRQPRCEAFLGGERQDDLSLTPQEGSLASLPVLPAAIDAATTAAFSRSALQGEVELPLPIRQQLQTLLALLRRMDPR